jgi:hypothetical protein
MRGMNMASRGQGRPATETISNFEDAIRSVSFERNVSLVKENNQSRLDPGCPREEHKATVKLNAVKAQRESSAGGG